MKNTNIEQIAYGIAIHMRELLQDTIDWQTGDLPIEKRQEIVRLSIKKLNELTS